MTQFAVMGRYPTPGADATESQARQAVKVAGEVLAFVFSRLPGHVAPADE